MIELLTGPLVGGQVIDKLGGKNWGNLMIALNPAMLGDPATIAHNVQLMLGRVKGAKKAAGVNEIMLPGERGNRLAGMPLLLCLHQSLYTWLVGTMPKRLHVHGITLSTATDVIQETACHCIMIPI